MSSTSKSECICNFIAATNTQNGVWISASPSASAGRFRVPSSVREIAIPLRLPPVPESGLGERKLVKGRGKISCRRAGHNKMRKRADDARPTCLDRDAYILFPRGYPTRPHSARPSVGPSVRAAAGFNGRYFPLSRPARRSARYPITVAACNIRRPYLARNVGVVFYLSNIDAATLLPASRATRLMQSASAIAPIRRKLKRFEISTQMQ